LRYSRCLDPPSLFGGWARSHLRVASAFLERVLRTIVYVDGFNLYYGALKKTPYRWVNLANLFRLLLPKNELLQIKYFTAMVSARPDDPGQPQRQQLYLRALATLPSVSVELGHFLTHEVLMPKVVAAGERQEYVKVIKTEEKGSDVNLATHLLHDAHMNRYDVAVVVSNDTDLLGPIKLVRRDLQKQIGVLNPQKRPSNEIPREALI
jgi:uncharacterized LabA/DUF88 family protein